MTGIDRRLARLHRCYPPSRPSPAAALDFSALTPKEQYELDGLLAKVQEAPQRADGRANFSVLTDAEVERLDELGQRITVKEEA
jgi:hypothetical protein